MSVLSLSTLPTETSQGAISNANAGNAGSMYNWRLVSARDRNTKNVANHQNRSCTRGLRCRPDRTVQINAAGNSHDHGEKSIQKFIT